MSKREYSKDLINPNYNYKDLFDHKHYKLSWENDQLNQYTYRTIKHQPFMFSIPELNSPEDAKLRALRYLTDNFGLLGFFDKDKENLEDQMYQHQIMTGIIVLDAIIKSMENEAYSWSENEDFEAWISSYILILKGLVAELKVLI